MKVRIAAVGRLKAGPEADRAAVAKALGEFAVPHEWDD